MARSGDELTTDLAALKIDRDEPPRRGIFRPVLYFLLIGVAIAGIALLLVPYLGSRVFRAEVEVTEVALVSPAQGSIELTATGYVVPQVTAKVTARAVGRVASLAVKEGDVVKKGAPIAYLDDANARSMVATARARVATARARAAAARAQLTEATLQAKREGLLAERGVGPKAVVEDLVAHQRSLAEIARAVEAEVRAAETEVAALEVSLGDMTVTSPIDGTVIEKLADPGELVGPMASTLVVMADFASLAVEVDVAESKLSLIKLGSPSEIVLDAFPGQRYRGATLEIGRKVDRSKATLKVKVKFVDPPDNALPDMAARVSFLARELQADSMKEPAKLVIPESAVVDVGGAKVAYVIDSSTQTLHLTNVQLGDKFGAGFVLKTMLSPGTKLVANPGSELRDGQSVKERND